MCSVTAMYLIQTVARIECREFAFRRPWFCESEITNLPLVFVQGVSQGIGNAGKFGKECHVVFEHQRRAPTCGSGLQQCLPVRLCHACPGRPGAIPFSPAKPR